MFGSSRKLTSWVLEIVQLVVAFVKNGSSVWEMPLNILTYSSNISCVLNSLTLVLIFHFGPYVAGTYVLLWRRGTSVLTASTLMVTRDSRFRLVDGYNLEISDVMPQDAGDYVCQLADQENRDQIHTVEILGE